MQTNTTATPERSARVGIILHTSTGPWLTTATVVKRDADGTPSVVRSEAGTLRCTGEFEVIS